ncbi:MAG: hypothetical protein JWM04_2291, partial [Verrucomicrobiales bacterium]|nr:hypothetical protein [Verrucomicrobiales bacterium]
HQVGVGNRNLGIIGLDIRENPENRAQRAVYVNVANFSTNSETVVLKLSLDGREINQQPLSIAAGQTVPSVFIASQEKDGVFTVSIDAADDLATDNKASIPSLISRPVKTLLVTRGNRFLEKALRAAPNVELQVSEDFAGNLVPSPDLVVLDNVVPKVWPGINTLAFHVDNTNWFNVMGVTPNPALVDWKMAHPVLRYASMDNVQVAETMTIKTPAWAEVLAESQQTPLILAGEVDRHKAIWVGFDNLQSTWPLRISFPIFIANSVKWLSPNSLGADLMVNAGDPFRRTFSEPVASYELRFPDGHTAKFQNETNSFEVVVGATDTSGIYRLTTGTNQLDFTVNLLNPEESNITPASALTFGKFTKVEATQATLGNKEIWKYFTLAALFFLLFEWWFYHRRTA